MSKKSEYKIVTIGGGTGAPIVLRALVLAGFRQIDAICAAMDSGGRTGVIRSDERDRVIAVSDLLRSLLALISPENNHFDNVAAFTEILSYTDGRQQNLGYRVYYALLEKYSNDYLQVQRLFEKLLGIMFSGRAHPVTGRPTTICFQTKSGIVYQGEHELDSYSMSKDMVEKVWLEPEVPATPSALETIRQATHIIYCPGSTYGSIIVNLLPKGVIRALKDTQATKILISNLFSTRNETHTFLPTDYWGLFKKYTQSNRPFDTLVAPDISQKAFERRFPTVAKLYAKEHSHFLGWTAKELRPLKDIGVEIIATDHYSPTPNLNRLRHDSSKLARVLGQLLAGQ